MKRASKPSALLIRTGKSVLQAMVVASIVLSSPLSAGAVNAAFTQAVTDYNAKKYAQALTEFKAISTAYPRDGFVHYYMGLCHQCLGHTAEARAEYDLASSYGNPQLRSLAQSGIATLARLKTKVAVAADDAPPPPPDGPPPTTAGKDGKGAGKDAGKEGKDAKDGSQKVSNAPGANAKPQVKTIIEFVTSWDNTCNRFEPTFESTKSQFKGIEFKKIDIEDPANEALKTKYNVGTAQYPTIVYLDSKGNVMENTPGTPPMGEEFANHIQYLNGNTK